MRHLRLFKFFHVSFVGTTERSGRYFIFWFSWLSILFTALYYNAAGIQEIKCGCCKVNRLLHNLFRRMSFSNNSSFCNRAMCWSPGLPTSPCHTVTLVCADDLANINFSTFLFLKTGYPFCLLAFASFWRPKVISEEKWTEPEVFQSLQHCRL